MSLSYGICELGTVVPTSVGVVTIRWGVQQARTELGTFGLQLFSKLQKVVQIKVNDENDKADHYKGRKRQTPEGLKDKSLHRK